MSHFTSVYKTWVATQGRGRATREADWKPPVLVQQLDKEVPEAEGILVLHESGRTSATHVVFQLPATHPNHYFCTSVNTDSDDLDKDVYHVLVYAKPPHVTWGLIQESLHGECVHTLQVKHFDELHQPLPDGVKESMNREWEKEAAAEAKFRDDLIRANQWRTCEFFSLPIILMVCLVVMYLTAVFVAGGATAVFYTVARVLGFGAGESPLSFSGHSFSVPTVTQMHHPPGDMVFHVQEKQGS